METRNQNQKQAQPPAISTTIAKAAAKGKFLDFRDNLISANPNDYAMVHGIGGAKYAARSTIKLLITDYTVQNNVKVVSANVSPEQIAYLLEVCRKNAGVSGQNPYAEATGIVAQMRRETVLPVGNPVNQAAEPILAVPAESLDKLSGSAMPREALTMATMLNPMALPANGPTRYLGVSQRIVNLLGQMLAQEAGGINYSYSQDRVHAYREVNGFCPGSTLTVVRSGIRKDGAVSQMPWCVTIKEFQAKVTRQKNGMTSYIGSTAKDAVAVFIMVPMRICTAALSVPPGILTCGRWQTGFRSSKPDCPEGRQKQRPAPRMGSRAGPL